MAAGLGALTLRLSGPFLPVGTIAWGVALYSLLGTVPFLGRQNGITGLPGIEIPGQTISAGLSGYYLVWGVLVLAILGARNLLNSRNGLLNEAQSQLDRLGLGAHRFDRADSLPLGKQRILEIARALCAAPDLLLLDEPAAGLREAEKDELVTVLGRLRDAGMGIVLVEHNLDFLMRLADRLVVMQFGAKLASGSPEKVTRLPAVMDAYLGAAL